MQIRTFTSFWNTERKLYAVQDIALPFPVSLRVIGVFALALVPWVLLLNLINFPFNNPSYLLWFGPPFAVGFVATKPWFQGKTIFQFAQSMIRYHFQPKRLVSLRAPHFSIDEKMNLLGRIFVRPEGLNKTSKERVSQ